MLVTLYLPIPHPYKTTDQITVSCTYLYFFAKFLLLYTTKFISMLHFVYFFLFEFHDMEFRKLLGIINVDSDATGRLLIIYSAFVKYLRKNGNTMKQCTSSL